MAQLIFSAVVASLLYSIAFVSVRADNQRLVSNETLAFGHTLISQNQVFEIGFFSPGKSLNRFLGIWYKNTPDVVVWVANRNHPISASESPVLMISENASLVISSGTSIIWSANNASGVASSNPVLHLLDSGNLVLVDDTSTTTEEYLWQSFDYPTDTLIPGMEMVDDSEAGVEKYLTSWTSPDDPSPGDFVFKIENRGLALADMVVLEGARKRYRLGPWNGMHFSGYQIYPNPIFKIAFVFKQQRLVSLGEPYEISYLVRTTLHTSGMILRHTMNLRKDKWNLATVFPLDACDEYAACGPNCICRSDRPIRCECLRGFAPKFQSDWDHQDWSGGCTRTKPLNCNGGDGFRQHSIADSKQNVYIRVPVSELAFINGGVLLMARLKRRAVKENNEDLELPMIEMATIVQATNNFSMENMIGVGGFGPVYKGNMPSGEEIAVKRLSRCSRQGIEEFRSEVMMIAKLQHRNLIRVLGCGIEEEERMLIYEYLQNKSLDYFVFDHTRRTLLTWPKRYDIIMGIARGLLYLHHDSRLKIIHRDLKTSNILLDGNLTPKISDFELARIFQEDQSLAKTKRVVGTYGYMAPEYLMDGKYSEKSDIFSLGVVLLEIISGKRNRGYEHSDHYHNLLGHAWLLWQENRIVELMDECLYDTFAECEVKRCMQVGLLCVQKFAEDRPVMSSVVSMLGSDGAVLPEPKEPGFFMERSCGTSPYIESENDTITITDLEAR
ncbi:G-type lectin S-receptor-like serine/threonine-protein kinase At4g27290 isoform X5 [Salvia hispanica]|uniref:G-type lectin S-receptor-like serine/threonine-protein kinase At4g27290 isoform X5 n=1 Tax=Salvia hispanica TaxID=49212 RepID=UPI002009C635|nr:G-type lectin S-receptor-like serine/threonine-protein kinase At4g27290 isoform X5 [Salvia hispanica]